MKKYIKPTTEIVYIETQQMIALSNGGIDQGNEKITPQDGGDAVSPGMSRRGYWDYDEEDEEEDY